MHVDARTWDNIWQKQFSGGTIMWSEMGKQNIQAKKVYWLSTQCTTEWPQHSLLTVMIKLWIELHTLLNKVVQTLLAFFLNENPLYHPKSMWNGIKQSRFTMKGTVQ